MKAVSSNQRNEGHEGLVPIPVFLPGESHGQRSLVGYTSWGHKELDMTEQYTHTRTSEEFGFGGTQF